MKVWRGFTLTVWVILLAGCAAFILLYHALSTTVLDASRTKTLLANSGTYDMIRDTVLVDQVNTVITERYPDNKLVDKPMIREVLADVLPTSTVRERLDPAITSIYRWLDSKEEDIAFSISVVDKKDSFYRALEGKLSEKLTALDSCGDYRYPPEEAVLQDMCLPVYVSAKEATQAAMGSIRAGDFPLGDTITQDSLLGTKAERGTFNELPTWLNILWSLNLLVLAVFGVIALLLVITRKSLGVMAIGGSLIIAGAGGWFAASVITALKNDIPATIPLAKTIAGAIVPAFTSVAIQYATVSFLAGIVIVTSSVLWRRYRGSRTHA